jgi:hypothetical protein
LSDDIFDRALDRRNVVIEEQRRRIKALEGLLREIQPLADLFQWNDLGDRIDDLLEEANP